MRRPKTWYESQFGWFTAVHSMLCVGSAAAMRAWIVFTSKPFGTGMFGCAHDALDAAGN